MGRIFGLERLEERLARESQRLRDVGDAVTSRRYQENLETFRGVERRLQPGFQSSLGRSYFQRLIDEGRDPESARTTTLTDLESMGREATLAVPGAPQYEPGGRVPGPLQQAATRRPQPQPVPGSPEYEPSPQELYDQAKQGLIDDGFAPRHVDWVLSSLGDYYRLRGDLERAGGLTDEEIEETAFKQSTLKSALLTAGPKPSTLERGMGYFAESPPIKALSAVLETGGGLVYQFAGPSELIAKPLGLEEAPLPFEEDPRKTFREQPRAVQIALESAMFAPVFGPSMAAAMGVGAIGGHEAFKAAGLPPELGELGGFVGGPLALGGAKGLLGATRTALAAGSAELSAARINLAVSRGVLARAEEMGNTALMAEARNGVTILEGQVARLEGRAMVSEATGTVMGEGAPSTAPRAGVVGALTAEQLGAQPPVVVPTQAEIAAGVTAPRPGLTTAEIAAEPGIPRSVLAPGGPQPPAILATRWPFQTQEAYALGPESVGSTARVTGGPFKGQTGKVTAYNENLKTFTVETPQGTATVQERYLAGVGEKPAPEVVRANLDALKEPPAPASGEVPTALAFDRRTVRVGDLEFQPERFQARDADPGKPYNEARVKRLEDIFDPAQYTPPHAVVDPATGRLVVYRGHHRVEAFRRKFGEDANTEVIVSAADISDPAQLQAIQMEGLASNFKTAEANFRERVRAVSMADAAGLDEVEVAQRLGMTTKATQDLRDAGRLGPGVVDQIVADNTMGTMAAELGKGMRVYGISQEEAVGLFNRILQAPKGQRPTPGGLAETINKFGSKLQQVSTEAMPGFEVAEGGSRGGLLAALDEHAKLETLLKRQLGKIDRTKKAIQELMENPLATAEEVEGLRGGLSAAERVKADIERQIAGASDDVSRAFEQVGQDAKGGMFAQAERPAEAISSAEAIRAAEVPEVPMTTARGAGVQEVPFQTTAPTPPEGVSTSLQSLWDSSSLKIGPTGKLAIMPSPSTTSIPKQAAEVVARATEAAPRFLDEVEAAANQVGGTISRGPQNVKTAEAMIDKARARGFSIEETPDALRTDILVSEARFDDALQALRQRGLAILEVEPKNIPDKLWGYNGATHLKVRTPDGILAEVQLVSPEVAAVSRGTALPLYQKWRRILDSGREITAEEKVAMAADQAKSRALYEEARAKAATVSATEGGARYPQPFDALEAGFPMSREGAVVREAEGIAQARQGGAARPTYATEAEAWGIRAEQGQLGIGAGERPVETAGPLFSRAEEPLTQGGTPKATEASVGQQRYDFPDAQSGVIEPQRRPPEPPPPPTDGPPPGVSDGITGGPIEGPSGLMARFMDRLPGRPMGQSDWAKYTGGLSTEAREIQLAREALNHTGKKVPRIGRNIMSRKHNPDNEAMLAALHGEGPIPAGAEGLYDDLQKFLRLHEERTLVDVPSFERSLLPQYFPRSWRNGEARVAEYRLGQALERGDISQAKFVEEHTRLVRSGRLGPGAKPGTLRHRTLPMSFKEAVAEGWEPVSWNPSDMVALHAADLAEWRFSSTLANLWKQETRAIPRSAAPSNWQTPPHSAFESRPYVTKQGTIGWSEPLVVAPEDMTALQNILGKAPTDFADVGAYVTSVFKRSKVLASYFQHFDLWSRITIRSLTRVTEAPTLLARGDVKGAQAAIREFGLIGTGAKAMVANFFPPLRSRMWRALLKEPDVALGMEEGLQLTAGLDVFKRGVMSALEPDLVLRAPFIGDIPMQRLPPKVRIVMKPLADGMDNLYRYFAEGLFDGATPQYMAGFYRGLNRELTRAHPEMNARQVAALAADRTNIMMSNIPEWQSLLNPRWRQLGRATLFSVNETEAWSRQIWSTAFKGNLPGTRGTLMRQWAGYIFGMLAFAELFNYGITGEFLTEDQLSPITLKDEDGNWTRPQYNTRFARPRLDGDGPLGRLLGLKGGPILDAEGNPTGDFRHIYLDLLGQADTPFRMFSPEFFIMTRLAPQWTTSLQQYKGERFFGERPFSSTRERLGFTASQLLQPISTTALSGEEKDRIGLAGAMIQTVGFNVSAERLGELKQRAFEEEAPAALEQLKAGEMEPWEYNAESPLDRWLTEESGRLSAIRDEGRKIGIELGSPEAKAAENMRQLIQGEEEKPGGMADLAKQIRLGDSVVAGQWGDQRGTHLTWRSGVYDNAEVQFGWPEPETEIGKLAREYYTADPRNPQFLDAHQRTDWERFDAYREGIKDEIRKLPRGEWEVMAIEENDKFNGELTESVDREWRGADGLREQYYELPRYAELSVGESDIIDGLEAQVKAQALKIASLTGNQEVDTKPLWRDAMKGQPPKLQRWILKYVVKGQGDSFYKQLMKSAIEKKVKAGPGRDLVMSIMGFDEKALNPMNPDRLLFKAQYIGILNYWFPDEFPLSRELAAMAPIPTQLIEASAAS